MPAHLLSMADKARIDSGGYPLRWIRRKTTASRNRLAKKFKKFSAIRNWPVRAPV
jgi:hypothetical protein